jgi:predicted HTH transcriptional regulator
LKGLVDNSMVQMNGTRRWAYYRLVEQIVAPAKLIDMDLSPRHKVIMEYVKTHGSITTAEYVNITGEKIAERTARKDLETLEQMGFLQRKGQTKGVYYVLREAG